MCVTAQRTHMIAHELVTSDPQVSREAFNPAAQIVAAKSPVFTVLFGFVHDVVELPFAA